MIPYSIRFYLSERYRLRFEDAGLEDMMDENQLPEDGILPEDLGAPSVKTVTTIAVTPSDVATLSGGLNGLKVSSLPNTDGAAQDPSHTDAHAVQAHLQGGVVRTLDGELAGDEFAQDAINYQILLGKIDNLLDRLRLDA